MPVAAVCDELTAATGDVIDLISAVLARSGTGAQQMADAYEHVDDAVRNGFHSVGSRAVGST